MVEFFGAVVEEVALELCDASCICSVGRKRRKGRESICMPGWTLMALPRQKGEEKGEEGRGSS